MTITADKLRNLYIKYNEKYFDGLLLMPKISTYTGVNSMGTFSVKTWKSRKQEEISIARNYKLTEEELRDLLLHEMIHQYVYEKYGKMNHGRHFKKKMNKLNQTYGLDIRKNSKHLFRKYGNKITLLERIVSLFTR